MRQFERPFLGFALLVLTGSRVSPGISRAVGEHMVSIAVCCRGVRVRSLDLATHRDPARRRLSIRRGSSTRRWRSSPSRCWRSPPVSFPGLPPAAAPLPVQVAELALFLLSGCLFLAVGHQLTLTHLKWLTGLLVCAGLITCALQMIAEPQVHRAMDDASGLGRQSVLDLACCRDSCTGPLQPQAGAARSHRARRRDAAGAVSRSRTSSLVGVRVGCRHWPRWA